MSMCVCIFIQKWSMFCTTEMSTKYLRGSKRLAIIQRWLNGHDDDEWEVVPTKKDGKYIVRQRQGMQKHAKVGKRDSHVDDNDVDNDVVQHDTYSINADNIDNDIDITQHDNNDDVDDNNINTSAQHVDSHPKVTPSRTPTRRDIKPPKAAPSKMYLPLDQRSKYEVLNTPYDPTINLEILEQLKTLGNELKYEREKKQQKKMIKHQINKQLNNHPMHPVVNTQYNNTDANIEDPIPDSQPTSNIPQQQQCSQPAPTYNVPRRRKLDLRNM